MIDEERENPELDEAVEEAEPVGRISRREVLEREGGDEAEPQDGAQM